MARATAPTPPPARPTLPGAAAAGRLLAEGRLEEAERDLAQLRTRWPGNVQVLTLHGDALFRLERVDEALAAYELAWATGAHGATLVLNLAACLTRSNRAEEALQKLDGLLQREPRHAGALRARGDAWRHLRRPAKALDAYRAALALQPGDAQLYQALAHLDHFTADSPAFAVLRARAEDPALRPTEKARVLATLGKAWMDVGEDDQAFACYAQANALMHAHLPPIRAELERLLGFTRQHFTRPLFDALSPHGVQTRPQIIIAGMSRSGKSLVESLFRGVAGVQLAGEELVLSQHREAVQAPVGERMDAWLAALTPAQVAQDARAYLERLDPGENIKITTVPGDLWNLGLVGLWTPQVPIIFCVRDVLDLGVTGFFQQYQFPEGYRYSYDQHQLGRQIAIYEKVMEHWAQVLPNPIYLVDYEALVQDPGQVMNNLLGELGLRRDTPWADIIAENAHLAERLGPVESVDAPMPVTGRFVGIGRRFQKHLEPMMQGYRRIVEAFPRREPPSALHHPLPEVLYDGDAAVLPSESTPFDWQLAGRITALDNGAHLQRSGALDRLLALDTFAVVSFDPAGDAPAPHAAARTAQLQTVPRTVLGSGAPASLQVCLDARYNSTLEPLPAEQLGARRAQDCLVLTRLPIRSVALDQIERLDTLDWLLLDAHHDSMAILEHGERALARTLLIHAGVLFQPTYARQPNLAELCHWAAHHGFLFYRLVDADHAQHMAPRKDLVRQPPGTQLRHAGALFVRDPAQLDDTQRLRLAFLLDTVYDIHDLSADLLGAIGPQLGENYLRARGYFDRPRSGPPATELRALHALLAQGQAGSTHTRALRDWARAWPQEPRIQALLAERSAWLGAGGQAITHINQAIAGDPADADLRRRAIDLLLLGGLWWEARAAQQALAAHRPEDAATQALGARVLAAQPEPEADAVRAALQALDDLPPDNATDAQAHRLSVRARLQTHLGHATAARADHDAALAALSSAEGPARAQLLLDLAETLHAQGAVAQGCETLWQACLTRPFSPIAQRARHRLALRLPHSPDARHAALAPLHATLRALHAEYRKKGDKAPARDFGLPAQGLESLMLVGQRPSLQRLQAYGLHEWLPAEAQALDLNCDHGYLLIGLAERLSLGLGLGSSAGRIAAGTAVAAHLGLSHITLRSTPFEQFGQTQAFDLILAAGAHHDSKLALPELGARLHRLCRPGAIVLLESRGTRSDTSIEPGFAHKAQTLADAGFTVVRSGTLCDDGLNLREFRLLQRNA